MLLKLDIERNMNVTKPLIVILFLLFAQISLLDNAAGQEIDDATLQARVEAKLMSEGYSDGVPFRIEVRKGEVQLGGWVKDFEMAKVAIKSAESVEGVEKLKSQLWPIKGERTEGQKVDDGVITTRVMAALASTDLGTEARVNVDTYNGVVLLTGFVDSHEHRLQAKDVAFGVENVKNVMNGISIR
jgi:hyperosmotically inducible protein